MPLSRDAKWTYLYSTELRNGVEEFRVVDAASVGKSTGYLVVGPLGRSRLGWEGNRLIASELGGTLIRPPLPILDAGLAKVDWKGEIEVLGQSQAASAEVVSEADSVTLGTRKMSGIRSRITLQHKGQTLETVLFFVRGMGIVKMEERLDGKFQASMEYRTGP